MLQHLVSSRGQQRPMESQKAAEQNSKALPYLGFDTATEGTDSAPAIVPGLLRMLLADQYCPMEAAATNPLPALQHSERKL
ncbi:hypothetical protein EYF80_015125 [Liparis tanakae]|uniref:Uncharacterized protein n=1 Tax=Liparis tanakae TaxID=230148 RepID=A0A4Z2I9D0_9TELE|nr:hypothetical protein EYF80_015125 [Liparis tanakae]